MKKKVAFYIDSMNRGGTEKATLDLVNSLDTDKYDVTLIKFFPGGEYNSLVNKNIRNKTKFPITKLFCWNHKLQHKIQWWGRNFFDRIPGKLAHKILIGDKYDVEIACGYYFPTKIVENASRAKKISWVHMDYEIDMSTIGKFTKEEGLKYFSKMDDIVCVSQDCEKSFNRKFGLSDKTRTIYNIIDTEKIISMSSDEVVNFNRDVPVLVTVGRLTWQKGYDRLLETHKELMNQGLYHRLYIIGEGEQYNLLMQYIQDNNLEKTVFLLGYKSNPYPYIKAADAFVCSSRHESFSLVVAESLVLGTPVVSTRCSGPVELLDNGEYGILTDNTVEALTEGVKLILSDDELRTNLAKKAIERRKFFYKDKVVSMWEKVINE